MKKKPALKKSRENVNEKLIEGGKNAKFFILNAPSRYTIKKALIRKSVHFDPESPGNIREFYRPTLPVTK